MATFKSAWVEVGYVNSEMNVYHKVPSYIDVENDITD